MRVILFAIASLSFPAAAAVNPFDNFAGEYKIAGKPSITSEGSIQECVRFDFKDLVGFSVFPDTNGYHQSYMLHFNVEGSMGRGWFGHPVMDFKDENQNGTGGSAGLTYGTLEMAGNTYRTWKHSPNGTKVIEGVDVSIEKYGSQYTLRVTEFYSVDKVPQGSCYYSIDLEPR